MLAKINQSGQGINSFQREIQRDLAKKLCRSIERQLELEVTAWLYRNYHERKAQVKRQSRVVCQSCGNIEARDFMRNGHRKRQLVTKMGVLDFWLPRVVYSCGGSVHVPFSTIPLS